MSINSSFCVENKKTCFLKIFKKWTYTVFRCRYSSKQRNKYIVGKEKKAIVEELK